MVVFEDRDRFIIPHPLTAGGYKENFLTKKENL
jgi:hypothetical protein